MPPDKLQGIRHDSAIMDANQKHGLMAIVGRKNDVICDEKIVQAVYAALRNCRMDFGS